MEQSPAFYLFILVGSFIGLSVVVPVMYSALRTGTIPRRPPKPAISKHTEPKVFWGLLIWMTFGLAVIISGIAVIISRLLAP
jgi:uncharacterized membrane protein YhaH (DUF805 family)